VRLARQKKLKRFLCDAPERSYEALSRFRAAVLDCFTPDKCA
jgi:hypothetical protein